MKVNFFNTILLTGIIGAVMIHSGCKKHEPPQYVPIQSVTLGVILPMDQEKGPLREKALRSAIDAINEAGGVGNGYHIDLIVKSSAGVSREAAAGAAANNIIGSASNLAGFVTSFSSEFKGILDQVAIHGQYPVVAGTATSGMLSGISPWFQRLCPPDAFESNIFIEKAGFYGITSVAIAVEEGDTYSEDLGQAFKDGFESGHSVLVKFKKDDPGYTARLEQLLSGNPEAILISMLNPPTYLDFIERLNSIHSG